MFFKAKLINKILILLLFEKLPVEQFAVHRLIIIFTNFLHIVATKRK